MSVDFLTNCASQIYDTGAVPNGDPDISGNGVILAFVISGYVTFASVLCAYIFGLVDESLLNEIDRHVLRVQAYQGQCPDVHEALRKAVLALSDQQIVTGIAVLGAGFQGLRLGTISVYHFQIVLYLAWLSSSVHLSCVTLLRPLLDQYLGLRAWRLAGMLTLLVMLLIGLVPTVTNFWGLVDWHILSVNDPTVDGYPMGHDGWSIPAKCFWGHTWEGGVNPDAVLAYPILFVSYVWKIGGLFGPARSLYGKWIRAPLDLILESMLSAAARKCEVRRGRRRRLWIFRIILAIYLPVTAMAEILASFSASLWLSSLGLVFGTIQIEIPRLQNLAGTGSQENAWGFGQLTPLILLIQPVGAVTEHLWARKDDETDEHGHKRSRSGTAATFPELREGPDVAHLIRALSNMKTPRRPFVEFIASCPPSGKSHLRSPKAQVLRQKQIKEYLYTSRVFKTIVWMIQFSIGSIGFCICFLDAITIGYGTEAWLFSAPAILGCGMVFSVITLILSPFSRLGQGGEVDELGEARGYKRMDTGTTLVPGTIEMDRFWMDALEEVEGGGNESGGCL